MEVDCKLKVSDCESLSIKGDLIRSLINLITIANRNKKQLVFRRGGAWEGRNFIIACQCFSQFFSVFVLKKKCIMWMGGNYYSHNQVHNGKERLHLGKP